ncbi:hypothetical protein Enr8_40110 [Blastopirellula retiformator]|uniref:Uncharacterized protein n=1 Tax=Blastopirellula retiformator TaxID=2527970 RepID=A0A5C5V310_9BACT|nr:hypothetical protein Enr8_40110 [Blastopirellula retiformator]
MIKVIVEYMARGSCGSSAIHSPIWCVLEMGLQHIQSHGDRTINYVPSNTSSR